MLKRFLTLLSRLPLRVHYCFADVVLYPLVYWLVRYRLRVVRGNLERAFPEKSQAERRKIERGFYHFFCDYIVETLAVLSMSPEEMHRRMTFEGIDDMVRELESHDFVFVYLGHYGNWEWISSLPLWTGERAHCAQLYRALDHHALDDTFMTLRTRFGAENIEKNASLRRIMTMKREGTRSIIGFISDQSPRRTNIHLWTPFFHQDTGVFTGTERIAKKVDAAIYFADVTRPSRGHYHCHMRRLTSDVKSFADYDLTALYMAELEQMIRRRPEIWLWSHKRWKHKR